MINERVIYAVMQKTSKVKRCRSDVASWKVFLLLSQHRKPPQDAPDPLPKGLLLYVYAAYVYFWVYQLW
jgi:hypothetical protein